jgi:hypothetical protein
VVSPAAEKVAPHRRVPGQYPRRADVEDHLMAVHRREHLAHQAVVGPLVHPLRPLMRALLVGPVFFAKLGVGAALTVTLPFVLNTPLADPAATRLRLECCRATYVPLRLLIDAARPKGETQRRVAAAAAPGPPR